MKDPRRTTAAIGRAYWAHHARVISSIQPQVLGWVSIDVLEGIEKRAVVDPGSRIAQLHKEIIEKLADDELMAESSKREAFKTLYEEANSLTFPATCRYLKHSQSLTEWTHNLSLGSVDLDLLRAVDLLAHEDPSYRGFTDQLCSILNDKVKSPSVVQYSQFFEVYGEAITLKYLRDRVKTRRVAEEKTKTPDFQCEMDDGTQFYVEVKSFDVVGGEFRHDEMMVEAIDVKVDLDRQQKAGSHIAMAEGVIDPYRRFGETDTYDPRSLIRVIDTIRSKCQQAFKGGQFALGPTFALTIIDRLVVPGHQCALAPYYYDDHDGGCCISGGLWHACFGKAGTPIFRHPDFDGSPTLEGYLAKEGFLVDPSQPFAGVGLITLTTEGRERVGYGLAASHAPLAGWDTEKTIEALGILCGDYNDGVNSNASRVSKYTPR